MLSVQNVGRVPKTIILSAGINHDDPRCALVRQTLAQRVTLPSGGTGIREVQKALPAALTWQPGETISGLPDSLENEPAFRAACDARILRVQRKK